MRIVQYTIIIAVLLASLVAAFTVADVSDQDSVITSSESCECADDGIYPEEVTYLSDDSEDIIADDECVLNFYMPTLGGFVKYNSTTVPAGEVMKAPAKPYVPGADFAFWTDATYAVIDISQPVTEDMDLYAFMKVDFNFQEVENAFYRVTYDTYYMDKCETETLYVLYGFNCTITLLPEESYSVDNATLIIDGEEIGATSYNVTAMKDISISAYGAEFSLLYDINVDSSYGGSVTVPISALKHTPTCVRIDPYEGYEVGEISIVGDVSLEDIRFVKVFGRLMFIMPAEDVTITVDFVPEDGIGTEISGLV